MADTNEPKPVTVSVNAGLVDSVQAVLRYLVVIVTAVGAILGLVKAHDVAGVIAYIQANGGDVMAAALGLVSVGTAAYGVFKTHKRGAQVATVAADPRVPDTVATLK